MDDRTRDGYAQLELDRSAKFKPGEITLLVPEVDEIHQMDNHTDRPTVEIHVYGDDLRALTATGTTWKQARSSASGPAATTTVKLQLFWYAGGTPPLRLSPIPCSHPNESHAFTDRGLPSWRVRKSRAHCRPPVCSFRTHQLSTRVASGPQAG